MTSQDYISDVLSLRVTTTEMTNYSSVPRLPRIPHYLPTALSYGQRIPTVFIMSQYEQLHVSKGPLILLCSR